MGKPNAVNEKLKLPLGEAFERDLETELEAAEGVAPVTIAVIDLDHFKKVNDDFGSDTGDRVLIAAGEYLGGVLPNSARLYRYSGDEFAILFNGGMEKEEAFLLLEDVRRQYVNPSPDGTVNTITIGVASAPDDGNRYQELIRKADGAMYRGKMNGSNRVMLAREEKMVTKTSHYTVEQLQRLTKLSKREGIGEAILLREALDSLLKKYDV